MFFSLKLPSCPGERGGCGERARAIIAGNPVIEQAAGRALVSKGDHQSGAYLRTMTATYCYLFDQVRQDGFALGASDRTGGSLSSATHRSRSDDCTASPQMLGLRSVSAVRHRGIMRARKDEFETHHLTELPQVHPSRRMSISERNWRSQQGWEPPELAEH